jgi:uncharacterized protein involved in exopolysaccharide biosynthesis
MDYLKQIPSTPSEGYYQLPPPGYSNTPLQEEREINLRDYWKVIRKRQWIIIAFFLIVLITTAIGTFTMKPIFRASTTIQINKENPQITTRPSTRSSKVALLQSGLSKTLNSLNTPSSYQNPRPLSKNGNRIS